MFLYVTTYTMCGHSFPTRRSSDLEVAQLIDIADMSDELLARLRGAAGGGVSIKRIGALWDLWRTPNYFTDRIDRKSTHLNSSHVAISYAVICLKKKN